MLSKRLNDDVFSVVSEEDTNLELDKLFPFIILFPASNITTVSELVEADKCKRYNGFGLLIPTVVPELKIILFVIPVELNFGK